MQLKTGSFLSSSEGSSSQSFQLYKEEIIENDDYRLERVFSGSKVMVKVLFKDIRNLVSIDLIPQGLYKRMNLVRVGVHCVANPNAESIFNQIKFNNLISDGVEETLRITVDQVGESQEFKRNEFFNFYHTQSSGAILPDIATKPLTVEANLEPSAVNLTGQSQYELLLECNVYDK